MKIAIYKDALVVKGGAAKAVIELANKLGADIITTRYDPTIAEWVTIDNKVITIGNFSMKWNYSIGYLLECPMRFLLTKKKFDYDIHIFAGSYSYFAARKGKINIWLCFTPNRVIYDLRYWKIKNASPIMKVFYYGYYLCLYLIDQKYIKNNITQIISQTKNVQKRVKKYYNLDSKLIYTPIVVSNYKFKKFGDYFLSVSRLAPEKRILLIAEAFTKMPNKKLVIVGTGSEKEKIQNITKGFNNITLLSEVNEATLLHLYSECLATIYMPMDEDFGLVPIEGMASGKACIAVNEGGCLETVIDNKTGYLIVPTAQAIMNTVKKFNVTTAQRMKDDCLKQAKQFDIKNITNQWTTLISEYR